MTASIAPVILLSDMGWIMIPASRYVRTTAVISITGGTMITISTRIPTAPMLFLITTAEPMTMVMAEFKTTSDSWNGTPFFGELYFSWNQRLEESSTGSAGLLTGHLGIL